MEPDKEVSYTRKKSWYSSKLLLQYKSGVKAPEGYKLGSKVKTSSLNYKPDLEQVPSECPPTHEWWSAM